MTAQSMDRIVHEGNPYGLCDDILDGYFELQDQQSPFIRPNTALSRGYAARWEFNNRRLYLVGLRGWIDGYKQVSQDYLFPDFPERVFAHWLNGRLRAVGGELLQYEHSGFQSIYERDVYFTVNDGFLHSVEIIENRKDKDEAIDRYGISE